MIAAVALTSVAGTGVASATDGAPNDVGTYLHHIGDETLVVSADYVGFDFDDDDFDGAGVSTWIGDNQGNIVFLWTSDIGDYDYDTEPQFAGPLSAADITEVMDILADHSGTGEWVCVNWPTVRWFRRPERPLRRDSDAPALMLLSRRSQANCGHVTVSYSG